MNNYITRMIQRERSSLLKERIRIMESITEIANNETSESLFKLDFILDDLNNLENLYNEFINANKY